MPASLLCETVTGTSTAEVRAARDAVTAADLVELRLDGVRDIDVAAALEGRRTPVIVTIRPAWEGGRFDGAEEDREQLLAAALGLGAEYVDLEFRAGFDHLIAHDAARIVLSSHDFDGVPNDLRERADAMRRTGAAVIKIAVKTERLTDTLPLADVAAGGDAIVIGMGDSGIATRLLATRYGSRWTYAGNGVAPGQIPAARMVDEFRFRQVTSHTRLFGVVSTHAMHSASPAMHNAAFAAAGLDAVYLPLRATDFDDFLTFAASLGIEGASVTIPFKLDALSAASSVDELTRRVGAANTMRRRGPDWEATNTDVAGFLEPLEQLFPSPLRGARVSVLGAGGSARAVVVALLSKGAEVTVHARRIEQATEVTGSLGAAARTWPPAAGSWDLLVNCTPLGGGARRDESPLPDGPFDGGRLVYDLTYGPGESALLRDARAAGLLTLDGLPMLIAQAERQFEWWTGSRPLAGVMRAAADRRLGLAEGHAGSGTPVLR
jgi:3-dehydroquinate dehydratase/shikimate dehydrogenase